ncbi:MAG: NAD(P)H-dependent oxidoreductase subunit E [Actinomycetota bacterium]|nr:NAD(P)H-dependent oxidoreductase subunit E [Actinomycetota bacterium]
MALSDKIHATADRLIARYPQPQSALMPLLYLVQHDQGYITEEGIAFCAEKLNLTKAEVQAVQTFYQMYERDDPGDWLVTVCTNFSCKVRGGQEIFDRWVDRLGGEHDPDNAVTVKHLECLGNCESAPVVQVNYQNYEGLSVDEAMELLEQVRRGQPPLPVNGEPPPTFREVCWRLAGAAEHERLHAAAVRAAQSDMVSYEEPPAERVLDEAHPLGGPGVHRPGPEIGDTTGVAAPHEHDHRAPSEEPPAGERLDRPMIEPEDEAGDEDDTEPAAEEEPGGEADAEPSSDEEPGVEEEGESEQDPDGESDEDADEDANEDANEDADEDAEEAGPPPKKASVSQSGGTAHVRRIDVDPGFDAAHAGDPPHDQEHGAARQEREGER